MKLSKINIYPSFILMTFLILFGGHFYSLKFLILSFILHELSHLFFIKLFNQEITEINLTGIGFIIKCNYRKISLVKKILISASGIIVNLVLLIISIIIKNGAFELLYSYNKLLILINLIPIMPLDGGFILKYLLSYVYDDEYINDLLLWLGMLVVVIITIVAYIFHILYLYFIIPILIKNIIDLKKRNNLTYLNNYFNIHKLSIK
ncbi:MAG: hypothetical protein IJD76_05645 [Bacilli bacterium]|nr:hypothetical protein [Bacilli bacterium]